MSDDSHVPDANGSPPVRRPLHSRAGAFALAAVALALAGAAIAWGVQDYRGDVSALRWRDDIELIAALLLLSGGAVGMARQMAAPGAEEVLARDPRPRVVYLRPFDEDSRRTSDLPVGERIGGRNVVNASRPATRERRIARALNAVGPFVAVGAPGDALAPLGAARLYLSDDGWKEKVHELVAQAGAIVLQPETSEGTRWEVLEVARIADPRIVLIVVPDPATRPLGYARIRALSAALLPVPLPETCARRRIHVRRRNRAAGACDRPECREGVAALCGPGAPLRRRARAAMRPGRRLRRLYRDIATAPAAFALLAAGIDIAAAGYASGNPESVTAMIGLALVLASGVWVAGTIWRSEIRRSRIAASLRHALAARADDPRDCDDNDFPDVPIWTTARAAHCVLGDRVEVLALDELAWA